MAGGTSLLVVVGGLTMPEDLVVTDLVTLEEAVVHDELVDGLATGMLGQEGTVEVTNSGNLPQVLKNFVNFLILNWPLKIL